MGGLINPTAASYAKPSLDFFARCGTLSVADAAMYDALISSLVYGGVWSLLDCLYFMAGPDQATSLLNLRQNSFNLTAVGGPTFAARSGFTGGTNKYLETGFDPTAQSSNFARSAGSNPLDIGPNGNQSGSGSFGAWALTSPGTGGLIGHVQNSYIQPAGPNVAYRLNATVDDTATVRSPVTGLYHAVRVDATHLRMLKDGAAIATGVAGATYGLTAGGNTFRILVDGTWNDWNSGKVSAAFMGGPMSDAQGKVLYDALHTALVAVGAV